MWCVFWKYFNKQKKKFKEDDKKKEVLHKGYKKVVNYGNIFDMKIITFVNEDENEGKRIQ